jgi:3-deoxy-D-manno-octulosonate 8-phosphate phosphatase (KDO 8-P phosphatase)
MLIKAVAMDVDGVLTDGTVWLDEAGRESKRIAFTDIMGVSLGRRAGLHFALISGEDGALLGAIAAKLGITDTYPGCKDKAAALREFALRHEVSVDEVCFIGDDVNDLEAFALCGLAVAPANAHRAALGMVAMVTGHAGGTGAVREAVDYLLTTLAAEPTERGAEGSR